MKDRGNLQNGRDPKWTPGFPNSQEEAKRQGKTYFMGERCLDCSLRARWAANTYCMQCAPCAPFDLLNPPISSGKI